MTPNLPDPTPIMNLATAYWNSAALLAANDLDLFGAIGHESLSAPEVAQRSGVAERGATLLLDACVGLGLLHKTDGLYSNAPAAALYLTPTSPAYLGNAIRWGAAQYGAWGDLADCVRKDRPARSPEIHLGDDPEQTRQFVVGMHNRALGMARGLVPFLPFAGARKLLDVGGGPGTFATLLATKYPELVVTVLDLPGIVKVASELVSDSGVADRIEFRAGDATVDRFGNSEFDGVLFSGVLHQMSGPTIQNMFERAYQALEPGGRVVISDMMVGPDKTGPLFSALFSLQMFLTSHEGAVFSTDECVSWLAAVGFGAIETVALPAPLPYTVVTAIR